MTFRMALEEAGWTVDVDREKDYAWLDSLNRAIRVAREGGATPVRVVIDREKRDIIRKESFGHLSSSPYSETPEGATYRGMKLNTREDLGDAIIVVADGARHLSSGYYRALVGEVSDPRVEDEALRKLEATYPRRRIEWTGGYTVSDSTEPRRELPPVTWRKWETIPKETAKVEAPAPKDEFDELVVKVTRRRSGG